MTKTPVELDLDPRAAERRKRERERRLWTVEVPILRAFGFLSIVLLMVLAGPAVSAPRPRTLTALALLSVVYAALSSAVQFFLRPGPATHRAGLLFLTLDLLPISVILWLTGGEASLFFFLPIAHVANQSSRGSAHVFWFGQAATAAWFALLALRSASGLAVDWPAGLVKGLFIWSACLFVAVSARPGDRLRRRFHEVFRTARDLVRELNEKTRQLEESREALHAQATRDTVTGLWNRAAILDVIDRGLRRAKHQGTPYAVVLADLDWFKDINDAYGHQAGDRALYETGRRMQALLRPNDAVGRYGGEEFLVALPDCRVEEAAGLAERLRAGLASEEIRPGDAPAISVTSSFGVAAAEPDDPISAEALVRAADHALYRAKRRGRNRVEVAGEPVGEGAPLKSPA